MSLKATPVQKHEDDMKFFVSSSFFLHFGVLLLLPSHVTDRNTLILKCSSVVFAEEHVGGHGSLGTGLLALFLLTRVCVDSEPDF